MVSLFKNVVHSKEYKTHNRKTKIQLKYSKAKTKKHNSKTVKNQKGGDVFDLSYIKKIEGPIYVGVLEATELLKTSFIETPKVLLLGDLHVGTDKCNEGCEESNGCYSLYEDHTNPDKNFSLFKDLDEKAISKNVKIDLFVEVWYNDINHDYKFKHKTNMKLKNMNIKSRNIIHNSALADITQMALYCNHNRTIKSKCPFKNIRIHMSDPRQVKDNIVKIFLNICIFLIKNNHFKDVKNITDEEINFIKLSFYNDILLNYEIIKTDERITKEYLYDLIIRILHGIFNNSKDNTTNKEYSIDDFMNEPFFQLTSKAIKQYNRLFKQAPDIAIKILENARYQNIYKNKNVLQIDAPDLDHKKILNIYIINIKSSKIYKNINYTIFYHIATFEVDLHTVCRMLKKPEKKNNMNNSISSLSIIYLGSKHIKKIKVLLKDLYKIKFENSSQDLSQDLSHDNKINFNNDNENIKCIDVDMK